jgi:large subunit ribosomal protein L9
MKVILTENVRALGNVGEVVNVSQGFGRNFLIPGNKAVIANENNKKELEDNKRRLQGKIQAGLNVAQEAAKKVEGIELEYTKRVAANGKLFGAVSPAEIAKSLEEKGVSIERRQIISKDALKSLGTFEVVARLFTGVDAKFTVKIVMDPKQIEESKKKQEAAVKAKARKAAEAAEAKAAEDAAAEAGETTEGETSEDTDAEEQDS